MSWETQNMMYNQPRQPNFVQLRQQVPQNIRSSRQPAQNNLMATSPASNMYQPQPMNTTMFMTPNQSGHHYMAGVTGQSQVITMPGGTVQQGQLMYPHFTINTSQPAQYAVPQGSYYPQPPSQGAVYYQSQGSAPASQPLAPPQQQQQQQQQQQPPAPPPPPQPQQQPLQQQQVVPNTQPQRPGSQPAHQNPYQKRERKALAIIDPETGKDISAGLQAGKTATPPQVGSGSSGTPVANTPPPPQPGVPAPPQPVNPTGSAIAAQFAAQVAATLNTKAPVGVKTGPGPNPQPAHGQSVQQTPGQNPAGVVILPNMAHSAPQVPPMTGGTQNSTVVAPESISGTQAPVVPGGQPVQIQQEPGPPGSMGQQAMKGGMPSQSTGMSGYQPQGPPQAPTTHTAAPNVNIPPPVRQPVPNPQERMPQVLPISASIPVSDVTTANQNPPPEVSQPSLPVLSTSAAANIHHQHPQQLLSQADVSRQSPPKQGIPGDSEAGEKVTVVAEDGRTVTTPEQAVVSESVAPVEVTPAVLAEEATAKPSEQALTQESSKEVIEETPEKTEAVESESAEQEDIQTTEEVVPVDMSSSTGAVIPVESKATEEVVVIPTVTAGQMPEEERPDTTPSMKVQLEEAQEETKASVTDLDKKRNPPRQRLKETQENVTTELPKEETVSDKIPPVPSGNVPEVIVNESKAATAETKEVVAPPEPSPPTKETGGEPTPVVDITITGAADEPEAVITPPEEEGEEESEPAAKEPEAEEKSSEKKEIKLKYDYKEDQWSPINLEGKKSYDRQFLLKLQYNRQSTTKPEGLPDLPELVLDGPIRTPTGDGYGRSNQMDFTPGYIRPTNRGPMTKTRSQQRGGGMRGGEPRKVISINREPEVQLQKAENPYKPAYMQPKAPAAEAEGDDLYRKVRSILNKLTPQKFQTLMQQILDLNIDTEEKLKGVIDIIFEKAIDEPAFSVAYANCCKIMSQQVKVAATANPKEQVTFKKLLLNRCQTEFEKDKKEATDFEQMKKEIEAAETEEKKRELTEDMEYAEAKAKRRSLGNIRFIGELFKLNMLTERIMHNCIMNLLKSNDEENLECLCRLVSTVGKGLDHEKAKQLMDQYFHRIEKIIKGKAVSSRIGFMLQDLVDLRQNNWKPRRDDNAPKTIEQIHKEAEDEKVEKAALAQRLAQEQKGRLGPGNRGRGGMQPSPDESGWQAVAGKTNRLDPSKMKLSKTNLDENIQLGPGGMGRFGGWGRGSTGGGRNASQEKERPSTPGNRFSALSAGAPPSEGDSRRHMGRGGMSGSWERGGRLTPANSRQMARTSQEKDREAAIKAARNISAGRGDQGRLTPGGSRNQSRESSRNRETEELAKQVTPAAPPPPPPAPEMSAEVLQRKTKSTLDEYLTNHDLKEAVECTKEIPPQLRHKFTDISIQHVLERSDHARRMTGTLLHDLVKTGVLSVDQYLQGLKETLEFAEDMEIDIPKIWLYLGQLIGPMVQDGSVPLSFLKSACEPLLTCNKAGLLVSEVLNDAVHRLGHVAVSDQWKSSGLQWTDFVEKDVNEFIKKHKLEYTLDAQQEPRSPVGKGLSDEKIQVELDRLIKEKRAPNENVFDWVDTNVGAANVKKPAFIRALMTSVCSSAITGHFEKLSVEIQTVKLRCPLLQRYLFDHDAVLEVQALYALQALVHKLQHPQDVLRIFFDTLYDEDIISEDAFNHWDNSTDPAEQAGRGVARKSVVQFFRWLREAEEEEQES